MNTAKWIFTVLTDWNYGPWVDILLNSVALSWFWANQSLILNTACWAEKRKISILQPLVWPHQCSKPIRYSTWGQHANHYTTDLVFIILKIIVILVGDIDKHKATTIFLSGSGRGEGPGIFNVIVNIFSEPSSVKIFFSQEKESKQFFYLSCGTEKHFSIKKKFLASDSINFFSATMQNLHFFSGQLGH